MEVESRRWIVPVLLAATAAAVAVGVVSSGHGSPRFAVLLILGGVGYLAILAAGDRIGGLTLRGVVGTAAVAAAAMVAVTPRASGDLWMYATYGRMAALHIDPWTHVPAILGSDPVAQLAGRRWMHMPSMYGPVMVWIERIASPLLGGSALAIRSYYQGIGLAALVTGAAIVWKHTRSASAVAYLALNPVVLVHLVNGGRNDALVGLALLIAVVMVADGHDVIPAALAGGAVLVKFTAGVGVVALIWWLLAHRGRRVAIRAAGAAGTIIAVGTLLAGPASLTVPLRRAGQLFSSGSPWAIVRHLGLPYPPTRVAVAVAATLAVFVLARHLNGSPALTVAAAVGAWTLALPYVLPGYLGWALGAAALERRSRVSTVLAVESVVFVSGYALIRVPWWPAALDTSLHWVVPLVALAGVLAILLDPTGRPPRDRRRGVQGSARARLDAVEPTYNSSRGSVLVIVPTYQEVDNVEPLLRRLRAAVPCADVLVVDDSSPDGTAARVEQLAAELSGIRVLCRPVRSGLASAYADGFALAIAAGYDVAVEMDADCSHQPEELLRLLGAVAAGADVAIGSRYVPSGRTVGWSRARHLLSRVGCTYARALLRLPVRDATSGFRAYRTNVLRAIDPVVIHSRDFGFQIEMTFRAVRAGARVDEVPITFHERVAGHSKMSPKIVVEAFAVVMPLALERRRKADPRAVVNH